jgi:hypothetical protein
MASNSDRTLSQAGDSLARQRAGGRRLEPIGQRSAELRKRHWQRKVARVVAAVVAILVAAMAAGLVLNGIGFTGVMLTGLAILAAVVLFSVFPGEIKVPDRTQLNRGDARTLVGNTELWLERQRLALPAPAVQVVDRLGAQLDALSIQLQQQDENHPAVGEVRKLVGEYLPEVVSTYTSIPQYLRTEPSGGRSPDEALTDSLEKISLEIDGVTRQLASGAIDKLAIRNRYLDYKYGENEEGPA